MIAEKHGLNNFFHVKASLAGSGVWTIGAAFVWTQKLVPSL
jgi:hypothetical protein